MATALISWATVLALLPVIAKVLDLPKLERLHVILNHDLSRVKRVSNFRFKALKSVFGIGTSQAIT